MKLLELPHTLVTYATDPLFGRMIRVKTPFSLLIMKDGSGIFTQNPKQTDLNKAEMFFLGGHYEELSDEQVTAITNAGYGEYIKEWDV